MAPAPEQARRIGSSSVVLLILGLFAACDRGSSKQPPLPPPVDAAPETTAQPEQKQDRSDDEGRDEDDDRRERRRDRDDRGDTAPGQGQTGTTAGCLDESDPATLHCVEYVLSPAQPGGERERCTGRRGSRWLETGCERSNLIGTCDSGQGWKVYYYRGWDEAQAQQDCQRNRGTFARGT
jgi:hypothetical protein